MSHVPKLTVYTIWLKPKRDIENSNRCLFRYIIGQQNDVELEDSYIFLELFRKFIHALDRPEMFSDDTSRKCMTANQPNLEDENMQPNIVAHSQDFIIEGFVEGGTYGKRRNKTSTLNKNEKTTVDPNDAITDDFYFFLYLHPAWDRMTLMIQSYSDDSIDSVMRVFFEKFFSVEEAFWKPHIQRFVPMSIINEFKKNTSVSSLQYTTEVPGRTLLEETKTAKDKTYRVSIQITPIDGDLTMEEFEESKQPLNTSSFGILKNLAFFKKKVGKLKDKNSGVETSFELDGNFEIQPTIFLSKHIKFDYTKKDFSPVKEFCYKLLEEIKKEQYTNAAKER